MWYYQWKMRLKLTCPSNAFIPVSHFRGVRVFVRFPIKYEYKPRPSVCPYEYYSVILRNRSCLGKSCPLSTMVILRIITSVATAAAQHSTGTAQHTTPHNDNNKYVIPRLPLQTTDTRQPLQLLPPPPPIPAPFPAPPYPPASVPPYRPITLLYYPPPPPPPSNTFHPAPMPRISGIS